MSGHRRVLAKAACFAAMVLAVPTCSSTAFGGSMPAAFASGGNFSATITSAAAAWMDYNANTEKYLTTANLPSLVVKGEFSFNDLQPVTSISSGVAIYNYTGSTVETNTSITLFNFQVSLGTTTFYSDNFGNTNVSPGDTFEVKLTYDNPTFGGITTLQLISDTKNYTTATTSATFTVTLFDPSNKYFYNSSTPGYNNPSTTPDNAVGTYSATNLPLPDYTTLGLAFSPSYAGGTFLGTTLPAGMTGQFLYSDQTLGMGNITGFSPFSIPEPSAFVMGLTATAIGAAGFYATRRKRLRAISR